MTTVDRKVQGQCPMGCGETLFLGEGGYVTCSWSECPNPTAMCDVMTDHAHAWHVVVLDEHDFEILHPLRERVAPEGALFACPLHAHLRACAGPPKKPGTYRVHGVDSFAWQAI